MFNDMALGKIKVVTTNNGGFSAEYWGDRLAQKICHISEDAPEPIRLQALKYREEIREQCIVYIRNAMASERTNLLQELK